MDTSVIFSQFSTLPEQLQQEAADFILFLSQKSSRIVNTAEKVHPKVKPSHFEGTLSKQEGEKFLKEMAQSRNEWERDI